MEFLKAFEEAKKQGVSKDQFLKIWEIEMKLKQHKEESRMLEMKLAYEKQQNPSVTSGLENVKELHQMILQLKTELLMQSQIHYQDIIQHLENQNTLLSIIAPQIATSSAAGFMPNVLQAYDGHPGIGNGMKPHAFQPQQQQSGLSQASSQTSLSSSITGSTSGNTFLTEDGSVFKVRKVDRLIETGNQVASHLLIVPDCPCKVQLVIWFNKSGKINAQLSVFGLYNQSLKVGRHFTVTGFIQNRNSKTYSELFEGTSGLFRHVRCNKDMKAGTSICLTTGSGDFENVTFSELEKRGYVFPNNTIYINWKVTSREADATQDSQYDNI